MRNFGKFIRMIAESRGTTPTALARISGLNPSGLSRLECGVNRSPNIETLQKIAKALRMKSWQLLKIYDEKLKVEEEK